MVKGIVQLLANTFKYNFEQTAENDWMTKYFINVFLFSIMLLLFAELSAYKQLLKMLTLDLNRAIISEFTTIIL